MVAGREVSPSDVKSTRRLKDYWAHGEGALKIRWGVPGDFDRCVRHLEKYVGPRMAPHTTVAVRGNNITPPPDTETWSR